VQLGRGAPRSLVALAGAVDGPGPHDAGTPGQSDALLAQTWAGPRSPRSSFACIWGRAAMLAAAANKLLHIGISGVLSWGLFVNHGLLFPTFLPKSAVVRAIRVLCGHCWLSSFRHIGDAGRCVTCPAGRFLMPSALASVSESVGSVRADCDGRALPIRDPLSRFT